jgi:hypothetical protein
MQSSNTREDATLHQLQREAFEYFVNECNPANGLVKDRSRRDAPCSIAAVGLALSAYPVGVERSFISRDRAIKRTLATLRCFWNSTQGTGVEATGYQGFYYHFLSMRTGRRVWKCEISTIDTALLLAGALVAASYYDRNTDPEREIRDLADGLYLRANWQWAQAGAAAVNHGWKPGRGHGFLKYRWEGYSEALLLYVLGLGSPTHPLPEESYKAWAAGFQWRDDFGHKYLYASPLFIHQLPQVWLDLRGIQDVYMREKRTDYFENSRTATLVQQQYAIENPHKFVGYSAHCWGITASDGPGNATRRIDGTRRRFLGYRARGVPFGPDDGTIAPWAAVTSLPFAPEIVLPAIQYFNHLRLRENMPYGFKASFNPTYRIKGNANGWESRWHYGLNQGPVVLMIENYRTGLIWKLMQRCPYIVEGLRRAGFRSRSGAQLALSRVPEVAFRNKGRIRRQ